MLRWALLFLMLSLVAAALGIVRVGWMAPQASWGLSAVFFALAAVFFIRARGTSSR